jgi:hypothetical protein
MGSRRAKETKGIMNVVTGRIWEPRIVHDGHRAPEKKAKWRTES